MNLKRLAMALLCLAGVATTSVGADQDAERAAIEKSVESYTSAFNTRDAKALAAHWSSGAIYVNPASGAEVQGRDAITKEFESILAGLKDTKLSVKVESIKFISPQVAVENGTATLQAAADETPLSSTYTAIHIKQEGKWLLDRVTEEDLPVVRSHYEHLKPLEWLIGSWIDADDAVQVKTTFKWTRNRNFITRFFEISADGRTDLTGMQVIGWDPSTKQVRSWAFDSDGGHATGVWTVKEGRWSIASTSVLPDGGKASSVNVITPVDDNEYKWRSVHRMAKGALLPNIDEVTIVRAATEE